ncbi:hypothetical protein [Ulvibacterium sp.]|uniref:hypothetical protein n=1 Tax=Ulvibacterium sp. TaxID=2665914 RepID=UPI003BAB6C6B
MCKNAQIVIALHQFLRFTLFGNLLLIAPFLYGQGMEPVLCYEEVNGVLGVEAEHFAFQTNNSIRNWYPISKSSNPPAIDDPDGNHADGASNGIYLELLPDTRTNHDEELIHGENFSNEPGKMAILNYYVYIKNPGKYYVWVRTHTSGTEDNGIHVGLDGTWPESGQRMQFDGNKKEWSWESRQRTEAVHTGVPELIYLEIQRPGYHTISFSMREDGFEFDKWALTRTYERPEGLGPEEKIRR